MNKYLNDYLELTKEIDDLENKLKDLKYTKKILKDLIFSPHSNNFKFKEFTTNSIITEDGLKFTPSSAEEHNMLCDLLKYYSMVGKAPSFDLLFKDGIIKEEYNKLFDTNSLYIMKGNELYMLSKETLDEFQVEIEKGISQILDNETAEKYYNIIL